MGHRYLKGKRRMRFTLTVCLLWDDDREGAERMGFSVGCEILWRFCQGVEQNGGSSYSKVIKCDFLSRRPEDLLSQASPRGSRLLNWKKRKESSLATLHKQLWIGQSNATWRRKRVERLSNDRSPDAKKMEGSRRARIYVWSKAWVVIRPAHVF